MLMISVPILLECIKKNLGKINRTSLLVALIFFVLSSIFFSYQALDWNSGAEYCAWGKSEPWFLTINLQGEPCVLEFTFFVQVGITALFIMVFAYIICFMSAIALMCLWLFVMHFYRK